MYKLHVHQISIMIIFVTAAAASEPSVIDKGDSHKNCKLNGIPAFTVHIVM